MPAAAGRESRRQPGSSSASLATKSAEKEKKQHTGRAPRDASSDADTSTASLDGRSLLTSEPSAMTCRLPVLAHNRSPGHHDKMHDAHEASASSRGALRFQISERGQLYARAPGWRAAATPPESSLRRAPPTSLSAERDDILTPLFQCRRGSSIFPSSPQAPSRLIWLDRLSRSIRKAAISALHRPILFNAVVAPSDDASHFLQSRAADASRWPRQTRLVSRGARGIPRHSQVGNALPGLASIDD